MTAPERRSLLCPNCRRLISADEKECPYCGTSRPASWWKNNPFTRDIGGPDRLIRIIVYLNVGMYLLSLLIERRPAGQLLNPLTLLSPSQVSLLLLGATGTIPIDRFHRFWSLISANYLHGGILHILFNMMALRQIAPLVIQEYGGYRLLVIYTLGGVFGYAVSYLAGIPFTIGASAAVCSLIGAMLYYGKSRGGTYGQAVYREVGGWVVGLFIFGFIVPGINNWGHGGGIVGGVLLGFLLGYRERREENLAHRSLAAVCAAATLLALGWGIAGAVLTVMK